jgi:hypothetical protein
MRNTGTQARNAGRRCSLKGRVGQERLVAHVLSSRILAPTGKIPANEAKIGVGEEQVKELDNATSIGRKCQVGICAV